MDILKHTYKPPTYPLVERLCEYCNQKYSVGDFQISMWHLSKDCLKHNFDGSLLLKKEG